MIVSLLSARHPMAHAENDSADYIQREGNPLARAQEPLYSNAPSDMRRPNEISQLNIHLPVMA